jgi:guanyl-specific ribonuclease Sa
LICLYGFGIALLLQTLFLLYRKHCSLYIIESTLSYIYFSQSGEGGGKHKIPEKNISDLPQNVQQIYGAYNQNGWKGNVSGQTKGTVALGKYDNDDRQLPTKDSTGKSIIYKEFDVNNKLPNAKRDAERFVVGSDGSVYYTDSHYGDGVSPTGLPPFVKIN